MAFNGTALLKNHPTSTRKHRTQAKKKAAIAALKLGGERGIRTPGTLLRYTRFPGVHLQPLGHLSIKTARHKSPSGTRKYEKCVGPKVDTSGLEFRIR